MSNRLFYLKNFYKLFILILKFNLYFILLIKFSKKYIQLIFCENIMPEKQDDPKEILSVGFFFF